MAHNLQELAAQAEAVATACSRKAWAALELKSGSQIWTDYSAEASAAGLSLGQRSLAITLLYEKIGAEGAARLVASTLGEARSVAAHWVQLCVDCISSFGPGGGLGPKMLILGIMREMACSTGEEAELISAIASGSDAFEARVGHAFELLAAKLCPTADPLASSRGAAFENKKNVIKELVVMACYNEFRAEIMSAALHDPVEEAWMGWSSALSELLLSSSGSKLESDKAMALFRSMGSDGGLDSPILAWAASRNSLQAAVKYAREGLWTDALFAVRSMPPSEQSLCFGEQAQSFANAADLWRRSLDNAEAKGGPSGRATRLRELHKQLRHKGALMAGEGSGAIIATQIRPLGDKSFERSICWLAWPQGFAQALRDSPQGLQAGHVEWARRMHGLILKDIGHGHPDLGDSAGAVLEALDLELAAPFIPASKRARPSL